MRNGDFLPTRLQAQQDAVNIICLSKTRSNPENNVGLITMAKYAEHYLIYLPTVTCSVSTMFTKRLCVF